jgi:NAD(P)H dehydrogenase (quinone)
VNGKEETKRQTAVPVTIQHQQQRRRPVVFVIYYSTYGHVSKLASSVREGIERAGCDCRVYQVAETLSEEILIKMHASSKNRDIPVIRPDQLPEADGFLFGMPTRFGSLPAQMKTFFDACGGHWQSDALVGKPVGVVFRKRSSCMFSVA